MYPSRVSAAMAASFATGGADPEPALLRVHVQRRHPAPRADAAPRMRRWSNFAEVQLRAAGDPGPAGYLGSN